MESNEGNRKMASKISRKEIGRYVECTLCGKRISDRRNLNRHLRSVHSVQPKVRKLKVKCSYSESCNFMCATSGILRNHLETVHGFSIVKKVFHFENREDFEKWKEEEESKTCASYVTDTGVKNRNKKKIYYLRCHRSGLIRAEEIKRDMRLRSKPVRGYTQCGLTCPSSMQILENENGTIDVNYFPKHLGHNTDYESVKYIKLRKREKEEITAKLVQGEPVSKIVSEARSQQTGDKPSRFNLLQKRDVYNIKSKVTFLEKEIDHDGKCVDLWVKRHNFTPNNNPIAFYKPLDNDNDYILVIIHRIQKIMFSLMFDGSMIYVKTKKGKVNLDFILTVVYAVNENGSGYPITFCVSSRADYATILILFKVIRDAFGSVTAQIFISDNVSYYYTAWRSVMGDAENKLICNFNIYSHWEQKLSELQCPFEKHKTVAEKLKSLLCETDPNDFDIELVNALNFWNDDDDLKPFVRFFYKFYCKKPSEWAPCYRIHSARKENINNYLEPLLNQIDRIYAEGAKNLSNTLDRVLLLIRNECFINFAKWDEDIMVEKVKEIEENHALSKQHVSVVYNGCEWIVRHSEEFYTVSKEENACRKECALVCCVCDICVHSFTCSCNDYLANFSICSHIHAVSGFNLSKQESRLTTSALKFSAVSLSRTITEYLEQSDLTDIEYDKIILDLDKIIKDRKLKDRFEDSCVQKLIWGET